MSRALRTLTSTPTLTRTRTSLPAPLKLRLKLTGTNCFRSTVFSYSNSSVTTSTIRTIPASGFGSRHLTIATTNTTLRYTPRYTPPHRQHQTAKMSSAATTPSTTTPTAKIHTLDHLVLTVRSLPETIAFYTTHLGMQHQKFSAASNPGSASAPSSTPGSASSSAPAPERHALLFGPHKINLHQHGREFEPKAQTVQPGSADLCFLTEDDVEGVRERFVQAGVEVLEGGGVVSRTGARGGLRSVYVRDPDGNLVE